MKTLIDSPQLSYLSIKFICLSLILFVISCKGMLGDEGQQPNIEIDLFTNTKRDVPDSSEESEFEKVYKLRNQKPCLNKIVELHRDEVSRIQYNSHTDDN
mmetsp:Transcript_71/g.75  ORF Transcript_71/g.75 Transcript_71/m.75 type:complete len:100 (+) Transcript_71:26-325(+)